MEELRDKVVLVTGGGRGIGRAVALAFAAAGSGVVVAGRGWEALEGVAGEIARHGGKALALACDVSSKPEVEDLKTRIAGSLGAVQILVNNAGIAPAAAFLQMKDRLWDEVLRINLNGAYNCCKVFLPEMLEARWGRIVNVASTAAKTSYPNISAYATSKHALLGLTRSLAVETARFGVTVNAVCPGYVDTPLTRKNAALLAESRGQPLEDALALIKSAVPQKRLIQPEEVAYVVLMLAGGAARGITGQAINIDGGAVMA